MILHRKRKLTIAKLKSSRLSYNVVVSLPLESISRVKYPDFKQICQMDTIVKIMIVD
jgi:hypothetical protein